VIHVKRLKGLLVKSNMWYM